MIDDEARVGQKDEFVELFVRLTADLELASDVYRSKGDKGLEGATLAIGACVRFLSDSKLPNRSTLLAPLAALVQALSDLRDGTVSPMLRVEHPDNRPANPTNRQAISQYAAATLELLMRTGMKSDDAAALVVTELKRRGVKLPGGRDPASKTVKIWRTKCRYLDAENAPFYHDLVNDDSLQSATSAQDRQRIVSSFKLVLKNFAVAI